MTVDFEAVILFSIMRNDVKESLLHNVIEAEPGSVVPLFGACINTIFKALVDMNMQFVARVNDTSTRVG